MKRNLNVACFKRTDGGVGYYRQSLPLIAMKRGGANVKSIERGDTPDMVEYALLTSDIVQLLHAGSIKDGTGCVEEVEKLKELGKKIVLDYDDDVFNVNPLSPHYSTFGVEEVDYGGHPLWRDGKDGFNIAANKRKQESFKACMGMADLITTTTDILAGKLRQYNPNVKVLPNCIDLTLWQKPEFVKKQDEVRLYWSGGDSHYHDFYLLKDVLPHIMQKYPQVKLVLVGSKWDGLLKGIDASRIEHTPWMSTLIYPYATILKRADISLIPLADDDFNKCKSAIKWVEQSALGIPSVVSHVSPYKELYNGNNQIAVQNSNTAWIKALSAVIEDRILAAKIGGEAQRTVQADFDIATQYTRWAEAYKELL